MLYCYIHRYKCTYMFKKNCAIGPYLGTHILTTIILGHTKIQHSLSPSHKWPAIWGQSPPHVIFIFASLILSTLHLLPPPFSSSLKFLHGSKIKELKTSIFSWIQGARARGLSLLKTRSNQKLSFPTSQALSNNLGVLWISPRTRQIFYVLIHSNSISKYKNMYCIVWVNFQGYMVFH